MASNGVTLPDLATIEDLEKVWKTLTVDEKVRAEALIHQASNFLRQIAANNNFDLDTRVQMDPQNIYKENVKMVILNAVQRVMATPSEVAPDATQWSQSASPYSESMSFSGGADNIYFRTKDLQLLGLGTIAGGSKISILRGVRG